MSVLQLALSWTGICQLLAVLAAAPVALLTFWTAKLLVRHTWYTHRMACFSKPHAHSWLLGHLGQVTLRQMEVSQFLICKTKNFLMQIYICKGRYISFLWNNVNVKCVFSISYFVILPLFPQQCSEFLSNLNLCFSKLRF